MARRIGVLGYGRFGASLVELCLAAGYSVKAFDPQTTPGAEIVADSSQALVEWAETVVLAMPVPAIPAALDSIADRLGADQLVMDVGSVKVRPCHALDAALGDRAPHAGAHPLFGPLSLARHEPLYTVVCPSPLTPDAAGDAEAFFKSLGSEVVLQKAEEHDRVMAQTHAMAFFIAKGLIEAGLPETFPFSPPSFKALAAAVEATRADAGHLFNAIQSENPYAGPMRRLLIAALQAIEYRLTNGPSAPPPK